MTLPDAGATHNRHGVAERDRVECMVHGEKARLFPRD